MDLKEIELEFLNGLFVYSEMLENSGIEDKAVFKQFLELVIFDKRKILETLRFIRSGDIRAWIEYSKDCEPSILGIHNFDEIYSFYHLIGRTELGKEFRLLEAIKRFCLGKGYDFFVLGHFLQIIVFHGEDINKAVRFWVTCSLRKKDIKIIDGKVYLELHENSTPESINRYLSDRRNKLYIKKCFKSVNIVNKRGRIESYFKRNCYVYFLKRLRKTDTEISGMIREKHLPEAELSNIRKIDSYFKKSVLKVYSPSPVSNDDYFVEKFKENHKNLDEWFGDESWSSNESLAKYYYDKHQMGE